MLTSYKAKLPWAVCQAHKVSYSACFDSVGFVVRLAYRVALELAVFLRDKAAYFADLVDLSFLTSCRACPALVVVQPHRAACSVDSDLNFRLAYRVALELAECLRDKAAYSADFADLLAYMVMLPLAECLRDKAAYSADFADLSEQLLCWRLFWPYRQRLRNRDSKNFRKGHWKNSTDPLSSRPSCLMAYMAKLPLVEFQLDKVAYSVGLFVPPLFQFVLLSYLPYLLAYTVGQPLVEFQLDKVAYCPSSCHPWSYLQKEASFRLLEAAFHQLEGEAFHHHWEGESSSSRHLEEEAFRHRHLEPVLRKISQVSASRSKRPYHCAAQRSLKERRLAPQAML